MKRVMLDLETLGVAADSVIVSVGAFEFGRSGACNEFYCVVDLDSCVKAGLTADGKTIAWWMGQSEEARAVFADEAYPLAQCLAGFGDWLTHTVGKDVPIKEIEVWGNGAGFDNVILANAYRACDMELPWDFRNDRCYRTVKNLRPDIKMGQRGVHHNALDDARDQASHLMRIFDEMGIE